MRCDSFYAKVRSHFKTEISRLPMIISFVGGDTIPNSSEKTIGETKLKAGDTIEVTTDKTPTGCNARNLIRDNVKFDSFEQAEQVSF